MKIDYDKYPQLSVLNEYSYLGDFKKSVTIISDTVAKAIRSTQKSLFKFDRFEDIGIFHGSIIMEGIMYCVNMKYCKEVIDSYYEIHVVGSKRVMFSMFKEVGTLEMGSNMIEEYVEIFKIINNKTSDIHWDKEEILNFNQFLVDSIIIFLKYADTTDKYLKAGMDSRKGLKRYANFTKNNVHYITSNYITNLYIEGVFKVSGHWRLQPYKNTKKLIWINEFKKQGYTRKAGILINN